MSGNSNSGKKLDKAWTEMLKLELFDADRKKLRDMARVVVARALSGDMMAVKEIADRLDGKPTMVLDAQIEHEHRFVRIPEKARDEEWKEFLAMRDKAQRVEPIKRINGRGNGKTH